jgi:PAS domain S-box-containing protein
MAMAETTSCGCDMAPVGAAQNETTTLVGERYRLLVQSVVDYAIYMLDPEGYVSSWNSGAQQIKGYSATEVLGRHYSMFFSAEDRAAGMPAVMLEIAAREGRYNGEMWRTRRDGSRFRALVAVDAIRDDAGRLVGFAKITRDITARWQAQVALEESERRFRLFVEGVPDYAICMLDPEGQIRHWNEGAHRVTGYASEDILGQRADRLFDLDDEPASVSPMFTQAATHGTYETDHWSRRKDGSRFLAQIALRALRDANGQLHGYAMIIRDVTAQRATEAELEATRVQLMHAQKLDALGQLTGGVAHDFNNILQAITSSLEVARLRLAAGDTGRADQYVDHAMRSVERAAHLTRRLLAFARRQPLMPACVALNPLVRSMQELLVRTVGARIEVVFALTETPLHVFCDASLLETALLNLAINGRDAMPDGGTLRIETRADADETGGGDGYAVLIVEDNGIGMSEEVAAHAFEPFYTTKPQGQGTGLGLSMIHSFMLQSQGRVQLRSAPGQGTRVELYLPVCTPDAAAPARLAHGVERTDP